MNEPEKPLNVRVAEEVFGYDVLFGRRIRGEWSMRTWHGGDDRNDWYNVPNYHENIEQAWEVMRFMCGKLYSTRRRFFDAIQDQATLSDGETRAAWPDALVVLLDRFPEAVCLAALKTMENHSDG